MSGELVSNRKPLPSGTEPTRHFPGVAGRIWVLIIFIVAAGVLVASGVGPAAAVAVVLSAGLAAARIAARLLGPLPGAAR